MSPSSDSAPIFVVGTGRSGTTLLRLMLNAHPNIYLTHEASFYVGRQFIPRRFSASDWLELYFKSFSFAWLLIHPDEVREDLAKVHPDGAPRAALPDTYRSIMRAKAAHYSEPRYGDKTPFHASYVGQILKDFPDARIIHILRDPRPTILSLRDMPWATRSWLLNNRYLRRLTKEIAPHRDKIHEVRLEDLLSNAEHEMRAILDFVGEPFDERVLEHTEHAPLDDIPPFPWLLTATKKRGSTPKRKWQERIPAAWIRQIEKRNAAYLDTYGYERAELDVEPSFFDRMRAVLADIPQAHRFLRRFIPLARKLGSTNPPSMEEAQRRLLDLNPEAMALYLDLELPERPQVEHR